MITTNGDDTNINSTLFEGLTKDERINFLALSMCLQYYKPMLQGKDFQDFDKINRRANEMAKFIKTGDIK